ncbi:MAG: hypothetical protein SA339_11515 [Methanomassiliicoccus sp.]|nr:hypothetical protein [Methanomassiliicoccus sp.]
MNRKSPPMHGGMTRSEFDGLRDDLKKLICEHPRAKFTILLVDGRGRRTEDLSRAARYGFTVHEDDRLIFEEVGRVTAGVMIKG